MPLFGRSDGVAVRDLTLLRRLVPRLMPTRNEALVFHEQLVDLTKTQAFIERWNQTQPHKLTVFHLVIAALSRVLALRPGLNRFVSGGRIYARREVQVSFAIKKEMADYAPLVTTKLTCRTDEGLSDLLHRIHEKVHGGRHRPPGRVEREVRLLLRLPGCLLSWFVRLAKFLDRLNLLPAAMTRDDPLFASIFVANLGSLGLDRVWHHLYEYGTVSFFCAVGRAGPMVVVGADGKPVVRPMLRLGYTFDERINDGHYCAHSLDLARELIENPERLSAPVALNVGDDRTAAARAVALERESYRR